VGGSNRRRQQRSSAPHTTGSDQVPGPKPAWRETFDSWGGFPVFGALLAAVIMVVALVYVNRPGSSAGTAAFQPVSRGQVNGRVAGNPDAPVKIIEFADFQCPYCKQFEMGTGRQLVEEFVSKGTVSIQFVSFAFIGEESKKAAEAAECAADQGHFWDYHDLLYLRQGTENSGVFSSANLKKFAGELKRSFPNLDTAKFDKCLDSGEKRAVVEQQVKMAGDAGVKSTPSFLVNGAALSGVQPIETFRQLIAAAQAGAKP